MAAIDIGAAATDRGTSFAQNYTIIALDNPANASGKITSVEIWYRGDANDVTGVKVGTFSGNGTDYTPRDYATIGDVTKGSKQTFSGLDIDVEVGDYIGVFATTGDIEADSSGGAGLYWKLGDQFDAGEQTYTLSASYIMSAYGEGATLAVRRIFITQS